MKKYGITDPLYMAFYAQDIYRDVAQFWRGIGLIYLLSLVALCTIPSMVKLHNQLGSFVASDAPAYVRQMPTLTIAQGRLSVPEKQPYMITDPATNEPAMIIDTTGTFKTLDQTKARILVTSTEVWIQTGTEPVALNLAQVDDMTLDHAKMYDILEVLSEWAAMTFYPAAVLLAYLYRAVQLIFFALLTLAYARITGMLISFPAAMRLSAVAMTPMIIIFTLTGFFDLQIPVPWLVGTAMTSSYLFFAIRAIATPAAGQSSQER